MLVIFTGCDRSGKTTLTQAFINYAQQFINKDDDITDIEYKHFYVPSSKEEAEKEYFDYINNVQDNKLYILDRFYESEYVYAPIYRNYSIDYLEAIEELLNKKNTLFVYMQTPLNTIRKRVNQQGDEYIDIKDVQKICSNFEEFFAKTSVPYITISGDYKLSQQERLLELIYTYMQKIKELNKTYIYGTRSVGKLNSQCIIVNLAEDPNIRNINDYMYQWIANKDTYKNDISILDGNELIFHVDRGKEIND